VRFLIDAWPSALRTENNFNATPVDTVLEKTKAVRSKKKVVSVFGLYDDPPTARLLLLAHRKYSMVLSTSASNSIQLGPLKLMHARVLRELNWVARKGAVFASLVGEKELARLMVIHNCKVGSSSLSVSFVEEKKKIILKGNNRNKSKPAKKIETTSTVFSLESENSSVIPTAIKEENISHRLYEDLWVKVDNDLNRYNLLARLRHRGQEEIFRLIVSYI
jgi:hypothetical protein